jgi:hypothetical protein
MSVTIPEINTTIYRHHVGLPTPGARRPELPDPLLH